MVGMKPRITFLYSLVDSVKVRLIVLSALTLWGVGALVFSCAGLGIGASCAETPPPQPLAALDDAPNVEPADGPKGWFIPKYSPITWYKDAELREPGGALPGSPPAFQIVEAQKQAYGLLIDDSSGGHAQGFVGRSEGFVTRRRAQLRFRPLMKNTERPPLRLWLSQSTLQDFFKGHPRDNAHDVEEMLGGEASFSRTLPILAEARVTTRVTQKEVTLLQVAVWLPRLPEREIGWDSSGANGAQILLLIDGSGSMEPMGRSMVNDFMERLATEPRAWKERVKVATFIFKDAEAVPERAQLEPFRGIDEVAARLGRDSTAFSGGGDDEEPLLDALHMAARRIPWAAGPGKRIIIAFVSVDVHARTRGQSPYAAPANLSMDQVLAAAWKSGVAVLAVQSTPEPGGNLLDLLAKMNSGRSSSLKGVAFGKDTESKVVAHLKEMLSFESEEEALQRKNKEIADKTNEMDGIGLYPTAESYNKIAKLVDAGGAANADWIHVPLWIVLEDDLVAVEQ